ncbi:MAG TPA: hypothetical protein DCL63_13295 [Firmicutes bacterium]|mgnify:CR=1 FL=1|nr:hypothetical protein [Bacillota bacterium]
MNCEVGTALKLRTMALLGGRTFRNIRRTPALISVIVVMACMVVLGVLAAFTANLMHIGGQLQSQVQLRVLLAQDGAPVDKDSIRNAIRALPGVKKVEYVSRDEALNRLSLQMGESGFFLSDLERNPLPDSFDVSIARAEDARPTADGIRRLAGVSDIIYGQKWVDNLVGALRVLWGVTGAVAGLVLVGASLIVSNTIKLSVFARRKEIEIMKLVGAADGFILFPFVIEGLVIGLVGAAMATALVTAGYVGLAAWAQSAASFVCIVSDPARLKPAALGMIVFGAVVGLTGSAISVRRYLRV